MGDVFTVHDRENKANGASKDEGEICIRRCYLEP